MAAWAPRGQTPLVRCDPGRAKVNFYGTLNLQTGQETVTQAEVMNSATTSQHLEALLQRYPERPLLLLWDRAPSAVPQSVLSCRPIRVWRFSPFQRQRRS